MGCRLRATGASARHACNRPAACKISRVKIDIFCHILPPAYFDKMTSISTRGAHLQKRVREIPAMTNLDVRFKMMDLFGDYRQGGGRGGRAPPGARRGR